jgi:CHAT domain-containing protein
VAWAWIRFRQGRATDSRASWERALAVREHTPGEKKIELQKVLVGLAQADLSLGDFPAARTALDRAHAILVENDETVSEASAAIENAYTNLCLREENYADARRHAEAQIAIEGQLGRQMQMVPAYALLGRILERLDEYEASETALREAMRLAESDQGPLQRHLLAALTLLGSFLDDRGRPEESLALEERALSLGEQTLGPDAPKLVRVLVYLADAQRANGRLSDALHTYERAGRIIDAHEADVELPVRVAYHRGLGTLLALLGDPEGSRAALDRGLSAAGSDPTVSTERAAVLVAIGTRESLTEALALFRARLPETHPRILAVINDLCRLEIESGTTGTPSCDDARARLTSGHEIEPSLREAVLGNLSALSAARGDAAAADRYAVQAVAAAGALGTPDPGWRAQFRLARRLEAKGERPVAIFLGKGALSDIEKLRVSLGVFEQRFLGDKVAVYRAVADWLMEAGRIDEGIDVLRLLKSEELYDFTMRAATDPREKPVGLTPEEEALRARFQKAIDADQAVGAEIDRLSRRREAGRLSVKEQERLEELLAGQGALEASRAGRVTAFLAESGGKPGAPRNRAVASESLKRDARQLGADTALALYLLTDTHLRVLVATKKGEEELRVPVDGPALRRDIGRFLDAIEKRENVTAAARALYDKVAKPVDLAAKKAGATRLVLGLDGALRYIPFAALHDGKRWLGESYAIEVRTGASGSASKGADALAVRGFGVTDAVAGYPALPAVAEELCSVVRGPVTGLPASSGTCQGAMTGTGYANAAFTRERFDAEFSGRRDFSVLHVGTHFSLRPGNALRSFLVLGDGSKLTLDTLGTMDFGGIQLLTLSACQTGLGGATTEDGREVEGLAALVARRGASRVIASLWEVEDVSTATLMRELYRGVEGDARDVPRALQRAQAALRSSKAYAHPYYWAGFVVSK